MERQREAPASPGDMSAVRLQARRSGRWSLTALVLVVALLVGSVGVPARFTSRILGLLRETQTAIEPARRIESRLELDLSLEATTLQEYTLTGDSAVLAQHRAARVDTDRDLVNLERLALAIGAEAVEHVNAARARVNAWRDRNPPRFDPRLARAQLTTILRSQQRSRDSTYSSVTTLESYLARAAEAKGDRIARFEEESITSNATLVLVALAAMLAVAALVQRERQLSAMLERRMDNESALRAAAEALAGAFASDDVTEEVARRAMAVLRARAAFAELITAPESPEPQIVVHAAIGVGAPRAGSRAALAGSLAEAVLGSGQPLLVPRLGDLQGCWFARESVLADCSAIVIPLANATSRVGAVIALSSHGLVFTPDDLATAHTFGHLCSLAYEKVRLLNEAREGHRALERVISSRSRLMRGFSHDIKNPLGAADSYADLLAGGVYGPMSPEQRESLQRLRNAIQSALALITDLHEFARAETGHLTLSIEPVVLRDLMRASSDEFRAAAARRGLALSSELPADAFILETDSLRVRQIVSNLLSNAIKYTTSGSVVLRVRRVHDESGVWAAIDVEDTGEGIASDQLHLLFEEFVRLSDSGESGAGLGLAISKRLAEALGGRITVRSDPGRGSCFTLWLPMGDGHSSSSKIHHAASNVESDTTIQSSTYR